MSFRESPRIVVIGAGIGGLSAAAALARSGLDVTVLEAHIYPGGCAGTFYHKGFNFDAGATLAGGFYPGGPMDLVAKIAGVSNWPTRPADIPMAVHLPDGSKVIRYSDDRRYVEHLNKFGIESLDFWRWQEDTADLLWDLALRLPPWPPQSIDQLVKLGNKGLSWIKKSVSIKQLIQLVQDAKNPIANHLPNMNNRLKMFIDGQLLISAQTTSKNANSLFGAAALDLPRRGVVHLKGGIGIIAKTLVGALIENGGSIQYRKEVTRIITNDKSQIKAVATKRGEIFPADIVIANLTPWSLATIIDPAHFPKFKHLPYKPDDGWGAFMVYVGFDESIIPPSYPLHHQVIRGFPLGEANSIFLSISPSWDNKRAPSGKRALTISTHTNLKKWWSLHERDRQAYEEYKKDMTFHVMDAAEKALQGINEAAELVLPGTPVTFQRFTRRKWGWVGGFPQTNLTRFWGPKINPNLWMVGDSTFPGQSTAATALGGIRAARDIMVELGYANSDFDFSTESPKNKIWTYT